jgi:hypothetical protein
VGVGGIVGSQVTSEGVREGDNTQEQNRFTRDKIVLLGWKAQLQTEKRKKQPKVTKRSSAKQQNAQEAQASKNPKIQKQKKKKDKKKTSAAPLLLLLLAIILPRFTWMAVLVEGQRTKMPEEFA